jgi:hypothetical protein
MILTIIVGEINPCGGDDYYALYPAPDGCSGHRLACLILGMTRKAYLESFERANLCAGKWALPAARRRAQELRSLPAARFILCGAKVCAAWGTPFVPFEIAAGGTTLVLPHPSGRNLMWSEPGAIARARAAATLLVPELAPLLGVAADG